ncbi:hypothetical protein H3N56_03030 [Cetobacterium sp. 2A]|uniref:hypothetical protein n=1 Tax=Cetobacterium sp. 2A TaxID=2754723 RepID=UPI00163B8263|nr:hypothetical protein [Cetobacterium sp. 2A]MBC2855468.1 hypothetical protein [Cetobacterium sp. 2A]
MAGAKERELVLELMYDMIERILTPREFEIYIMSKRMKPRHIADKLGLKGSGVRRRLVKIKYKIKNHEKWLREKIDLRGLAI